MTYLVIWRLPASPTPVQRLVSQVTEATTYDLSALAELAHLARVEADLADVDGVHCGRVRADMSVSLGGSL